MVCLSRVHSHALFLVLGPGAVVVVNHGAKDLVVAGAGRQDLAGAARGVIVDVAGANAAADANAGGRGVLKNFCFLSGLVRVWQGAEGFLDRFLDLK